MPKRCDICGKNLSDQTALVGFNDKVFCSTACSEQYQQLIWTAKPINRKQIFFSDYVICSYCEDLQLPEKAYAGADRKLYCSTACRALGDHSVKQ